MAPSGVYGGRITIYAVFDCFTRMWFSSPLIKRLREHLQPYEYRPPTDCLREEFMEFVIAFEQGLPPIACYAVMAARNTAREAYIRDPGGRMRIYPLKPHIDSAVDFSMVNNIDPEHNS